MYLTLIFLTTFLETAVYNVHSPQISSVSLMIDMAIKLSLIVPVAMIVLRWASPQALRIACTSL